MRAQNMRATRSIKMRSRVLIFGFALWAGIMFHASAVLAQNKLNLPPVANAGAGQTVALTLHALAPAAATLDGSASTDPDGDPLTYEWRDANGSVIGTTPTVALRFFSSGHYTYVLTVNDGRRASSSDSTFVNVVADTTPPVVYPPRDLTVGITETGGARGSGSSDLAAFLVGAKAVDDFDPRPTALPPQVGGANADNNTFFPEGSTVVTFSFSDASGNVGTATANVTVLDLQPGDLFVGGATYADSYGTTVGGIFRVRGGTATLYCQPESSYVTDPRFWNVPQDVMVDAQGRVVFVAYQDFFYLSGAGFGLYRCGSLGAIPELVAEFPQSFARPSTDPMPFGSMQFDAESGMHLEESRDVIIDDTKGLSASLVTDDAYVLALSVVPPPNSTATEYVKSVRYHPLSGTWDDGPDLGKGANQFSGVQGIMPDMAFHSGAAYVVGGNTGLHRDKVPLRVDASGSIGGVSFTASLSLFGGSDDYPPMAYEHDSSFPTVSSGCPSGPYKTDMPFLGTAFEPVVTTMAIQEVVYDEYTGFGLVIGSDEATGPYLTNVSEALLDNPGGTSNYFTDPFLGCAGVPEVDVSSPLPYSGKHGVNGARSLVSTPNGVFGVAGGTNVAFLGFGIVQIAPGVDPTDQAILISGLPAARGLGAWPPKLSAGFSADVIIRLDSPVNVLVTDANGKRLGVDAGGNPVNDFGLNGFDSGPGEPRFYAINNPTPGDFQMQAVGTGDGPYTIHVYAADFSIPVGPQILTTGTTSVGAASRHDFTMAADYTLAFLPTDIPTANAGGDQTVTTDSTGTALVTLNGSASSDPLGTPLTFLWAGPFGALGGAVITPRLPAGTFVIKLTVDNGGGGIASANVTVTVNPAPTVNPPVLMVTGANATRTYGAANPAFTGTITGIVNGDNITATYSTVATPGSPVGTYAIVPTLVDPGNKLGNYTVISNNGTLTVNPAALTVTAANTSRTYGAANPAFTGTITGIQNGDNIIATYNTIATSASPVGPYAVVPTLVDPGNKLGDYTVLSNNGNLSVTPALLTITAYSASRPYGANNPALTGTIVGIQNLDPIGATYTPSATPGSNVGSYAIIPAAVGPANVLSNYTLALVNGTLTIGQETTSLNVTFSPLSIMVGQSTTATVTLTAPDMVIPIDPSVLAPMTLSSPVVSDILTNNGVCTPVPSTAPGVASCVFAVTSVEPNGRTLNASFGGSPDLAASSATTDLIVTAALESQKSCLNSDFRNVAVPGGSTLWFNSIFKVRDVTKQKITITFFQSSVQFQYTDASNNVVTVNQPMPDAKIVIDPSVTTASTTFDAVDNVWLTTTPFDLDDAAFLTGMPWLVPPGGLPADVEPVAWCGTFASDTTGVDIGWRWAAAAYSSFSGDNSVLGVKPMFTDHDNPGTNRDLAGTPENFKQFLIPGARGKGGKNYTGTYSRSAIIE